MVNTETEGKNIKVAVGGNDTKYLGGDIGNYIFLLTPARKNALGEFLRENTQKVE